MCSIKGFVTDAAAKIYPIVYFINGEKNIYSVTMY